MPEIYPLIRASGSARELGRQHGEQAKTQIRAFLDFLRHSLGLTREQVRDRAHRFRPLFGQASPRLMEEIRGLAEGAGVAESDALAVQIRGELGQVTEEACTTFVIGRTGTKNGQVLIGQTSDMGAEMPEFAYVLHLTHVAEGNQPPLQILMWTFGGMLGYHGMNSRGVAQFANSLGGGPAWRWGLPHYPVKRFMLESKNLEEVLAAVSKNRVCSSGNYVLCDRGGKILDVELTAEGPEILRDEGAGFLVHANHFLCGPQACAENFEKSLPDSFPRQSRMEELIREKLGQITVVDMQGMLRDHAGFPTSICRHPHAGAGDPILPNTGKTVAAIIAEPEAGKLHVARGNPCENEFVTYAMTVG